MAAPGYKRMRQSHEAILMNMDSLSGTGVHGRCFVDYMDYKESYYLDIFE